MQSQNRQSKGAEQSKSGVVPPGVAPLVPEAGRVGRPRVPLRPRASAARPDQEPGDLLQLQRVVGNRAVAREIGRRAVQRRVVNARSKPQTDADVLSHLKRYEPDVYGRLIGLGESDNTLLLAIQTFVADGSDHPLYEMAKKLEEHIKVTRFVADQSIPGPDGIDVKLWNLKKTFPGGLDKNIKPGGSCNVDTKIMEIEAELAIDGTPTALSNWEAGFVQTVVSLSRNLTIAHTNGVVQQQTTTLPGPTRDGPSGYAGPWFDPGAFGGFAGARSPIKVGMRDRPGVSWGLGADTTGANLSGRDTFKTWLVLRHKTDHRVIFLRTWTWAADYVNGISGGAESADSGSDAVLGGAVGKDSFVVTPFNRQRLPTIHEYSSMKKQATKSVTFRSGMMPKKVYGQLVSQFSAKIAGGDFAAAAGILQTIKANLDLMDAKGAEYWRSDQLKAQHFQPIMDDVDAMIRYVGELT
jgi:hypothetical protein